MPQDDSKYIQLHAKRLNKREGHQKAKTIALEKKRETARESTHKITHEKRDNPHWK